MFLEQSSPGTLKVIILEKPNNLKVFGSKETKWPKKDSKIIYKFLGASNQNGLKRIAK
jgi:hypothetical protein